MEEFSATSEVKGDFIVAHMTGAIVAANLPITQQKVNELVKQHDVENRKNLKIIIDYSGVTDVDSTTVANIVQRLNELDGQNHKFAFIHVLNEMKEYVKLYRVESLIQIYKNEEEAMREMNRTA